MLFADIEAEIVEPALDTICHTLITEGLFPDGLEEVLYNGWYGCKVIVQLDTIRLYCCRSCYHAGKIFDQW